MKNNRHYIKITDTYDGQMTVFASVTVDDMDGMILIYLMFLYCMYMLRLA
jgi:hypothetical protein